MRNRILLIPAYLILAAPLGAQTPSRTMRPLPMAPPDSVARAVPVGRPAASQVLHVSVSLPYNDPVGMSKFVDSVSDPKSPSYRRFLTPDQVGARFGLPAAQVRKVTNYLSAQGFTVRLVGHNRLSILADATVAQVEAAFHTSIQSYYSADIPTPKEGLYSFATGLSLPAEIAPLIVHVGGLENFSRPKAMAAVTPTMVRTLYNTAPIYGAGMHGEGRTIGISSFDGFRLSALPNVYSKFSLPTPSGGVGTNVTVKAISGGSGAGVQEGEGDLDIQSVLGVAPLCNLIVYDGGNGDLIGVLTQEVEDNLADVVTESYGWELSGSESTAAHNLHLSMDAQGMTYMAASGDNGTNLSYFYPGTDPEVLMVGGTSVTTDASGNRLTETGWSGSGGGWHPTADSYNVLPGYQKGTGVPTTINSRLIPDVALDADPNSGYVVYLVAGQYDEGGTLVNVSSGFYVIGGTSGATPTFAASLALSEQKLISLGNLGGSRRLGRIQDLLYSFNGSPSVFFDVVSGSNGVLPSGATSSATVGWDFVTGWGAMNFNGFVSKFTGNTAKVSSVSLSPTTVEGGSPTTVTGTVTLSSVAPSGGASVNLSSSSSAASVPVFVTVPANATTATFTVTTNSVSSSTPVTITASGSNSATATLTLTPPHATGLTLSPSTVTGASSSAITGTVTLDLAAATGGQVVNLSSANTALAAVPATVVVAAGKTTASFTVTTFAVTASTSVVITATGGGMSTTATLSLGPTALGGVSLSPSAVTGGLSSTGTISLTGPAPAGGAKVALALSDTTDATLSATSVTIAAGATTGTFTIATKPVNAAKTETVTATYGIAKTASLTIGLPVIASVSSSAATNIGGVNSPTITVALSGPANSSGAVVKLAATPATAAKFSVASITIPAGKSTGTATLTTFPVNWTSTVTVTATYSGSKETTLSVQQAQLSGLTLNVTSVVGGSSVTGTVTLNGPAAAAFTVTLTSSDPTAAPVPPTAKIAAGAKTGTFTFKTATVKTATSVTISAKMNSVFKSVGLTVNQ